MNLAMNLAMNPADHQDELSSRLLPRGVRRALDAMHGDIDLDPMRVQ